MAETGPITLFDIQKALLSNPTGKANILVRGDGLFIDKLLHRVPMDEWESVINDNYIYISEMTSFLVARAAKYNHALEVEYCARTKTEPFELTFCDARGCINNQMAQPLDMEDFPGSNPNIDYENDCVPFIPIRRNGGLIGPRSHPRISICLDCFYVSRVPIGTEKQIYMCSSIESAIVYGAVGLLVPDQVRTWMIEDDDAYFGFDEHSTVSKLGQLVVGMADTRLINLLKTLTPV